MHQVEELEEIRKNLKTPKKPKTAHEETVDSYVSFFATQVKMIPEDFWMPFVMENMTMVNSYIQKTPATPQYEHSVVATSTVVNTSGQQLQQVVFTQASYNPSRMNSNSSYGYTPRQPAVAVHSASALQASAYPGSSATYASGTGMGTHIFPVPHAISTSSKQSTSASASEDILESANTEVLGFRSNIFEQA